MLGGQPIGELGRGVAAAVVDGDDLELVGQRGQHLERLGDDRLDVLGLVVGGKEERQRRDARSLGGHCGDLGHGRIIGASRLGDGHQPRVTPQYTPQALITIDAATSATVHQRTPKRAMASVTRISANGAKSLLKR